MKLSTNFVTLALALTSATALAEPVHHRHAIRHAGHKHHMRRGVTRTEIIYHTVTVDENGVPWSTSTEGFKGAALATPSAVQKLKSEILSKATSTSTSEKSKPTKEPVKKPSGPTGVDAPFPDGEIDCNHFPEEYGAVAVEWVGYKKWTGIQETHVGGGAKPDCEEGCLCSYACPPGYSKSQWPEMQPASGESHGGLLCKNGKLYKTNSNSETLCEKGAGNVYVKNELSKAVPICRTDYPGSENMVVPLFSTPGSTLELTCPKTETAYKWRGGKTSAQYYVNPQGTALEDGCVWGKPNGGLGNWSPLNFGASTDGGVSYISVFQNQLNSEELNFNIRIEGTGKILGNCKYENGKFYGDGATADGCTSSLVSGEAFFVLYDRTD
jgi:hypothetical protein